MNGLSSRLAPLPSLHRWILLIAGIWLTINLALLTWALLNTPGWRAATALAPVLEAAQAIQTGQTPYIAGQAVRYGQPDRYPYRFGPALAEFLGPLLWLGPDGMRLAWLLLSIGFLLTSLLLLGRSFGNRLGWPWLALVSVMGLGSVAIRNELLLGQVTYLLLLLVLLGVWCYVRRASALTAVIWGCLIAIKPILVVLAIYLYWRRDRRTALFTVVSAAAWAGLAWLPLAASSRAVAESWWASLAFTLSAAGLGARPDNISLPGLMMQLFVANPYTRVGLDSPLLASGLYLVAVLALGGLTLIGIPRHPLTSFQRSAARGRLLLEVGLLMALTLLMGPYSTGSEFSLLLPGLAGTIMIARDRRLYPIMVRLLWSVAAISWSALLLVRLSPISISASWYGTAFAIPNEAGWLAMSGSTILHLGQAAYLLVLTIALTVAAVRYERQRAELVETQTEYAIRWWPISTNYAIDPGGIGWSVGRARS